MTRPTIVAHRGASGYLPEHTLAAYELGIRQGADAFEIDVVPTRDGVLIARHENDLSGSTDIAQHAAFADRRTTKTVNGHEITGWFSEDFTTEEIKELRCVEPLPGRRSAAHDGQYAVPTLREVLDLRASLSVELDRPVGLKLEVKTPEYFTSCRLPIEDLLIPELTRAGVKEAGSPVEVMTFELHHLRMLRTLSVHAGMVFLVEEDLDLPVPGEGGATYGDLLTPGGLARVHDTATAIGPGRAVLFPPSDSGALGSRVACSTGRTRSVCGSTAGRSGPRIITCQQISGWGSTPQPSGTWPGWSRHTSARGSTPSSPTTPTAPGTHPELEHVLRS